MLNQKPTTITAAQFHPDIGDCFLPTVSGLRRGRTTGHVQVLTMQRQHDSTYKATCFDFDHCRVCTYNMLPQQPLIVEV